MKNKTCLITGASRGLGKFLAHFFSKQNFNLILVSSNIQQLSSTSQELKLSSNQRILLIEADFSTDDFEKDMFKKIRKFTSSLDILINNAAIQGPIGPFADTVYEEWKRVFKVNFFAPTVICHRAIELMESSGGTIINLSGGGSAGLRTNFSAYASSKTALVRFSETLASELIHKRINVNAIAPGPLPTDMMREIINTPKERTGNKEFEAAKNILESEADMTNIGELCLFLFLNKGRGISGKLISVKWDNWKDWPRHLEELNSTDLYTLRRVAGRDRDMEWGDK